MMNEINHPLVESTRPPLYTAMKYWGKKPHNIWHDYIKNYTPEGGTYLDPFVGSCISALEAFKAGRKTVAFDLNPLSAFMLEVLSSPFDAKAFEVAANAIISQVAEDATYRKLYATASRNGAAKAILQHAKWENGKISKIGVCDVVGGGLSKPYMAAPTEEDKAIADDAKSLTIPFWHPDKPFHNTPSIKGKFIQDIGGNNFSHLWTRRNLYTLSKIFDLIRKVENAVIQKQLLFGFIQTLHLCTKMTVPRNEKSNRDFSTSWGRSAYLCAARQMEMNPLFVFKGSCFGKQSVTSALEENEKYLGKLPKLLKVGMSNKDKNKTGGFDIKYGTVDVVSLGDYIPAGSVDFVMADPPYGGLVQYLDLSTLWLIWLEKIDDSYKPNYDAEITIKPKIFELDIYQKRFTKALEEIHKVLKADGKAVFTFHNKDLKIWNSFLRAISRSGFVIEKVIHQQNRRSGESNVANPYGTSGSDFYIRCVKGAAAPKTDEDDFSKFVTDTAINILATRGEPTPYEFLFSGLLARISSEGYDLDNFDEHLNKALSDNVGSVFVITKNEENKAGNLWWLKEPGKHINRYGVPLGERVERSVLNILLRETSVTLDQVLAEIFRQYTDGLTPDMRAIDDILGQYATQSQGKWLISSAAKEAHTKHTQYLRELIKIGRKCGFSAFVGRREQPEAIDGTTLGALADVKKIDFISEAETTKRVEMIDMLWLKDGQIAMVIEVENSTNFTSGIQRASNLPDTLPKIMVIPDHRKDELLKTKDPLFVASFKDHNWKYITYGEIDKLAGMAKLDASSVTGMCHDL